MKTFKNFIVSALLLAGLIVPVFAVAGVSAQIDPGSIDVACEGLGAGAGNACDDTAKASVGSIISTVIEILSWIVGILAVVMIVIAGLNFITANGDSSKVQKARSSIIYAMIGIAVAISAQILVHFVIGQVSTTVGRDSGGNYTVTCEDGRSIAAGTTEPTREQAEALCG